MQRMAEATKENLEDCPDVQTAGTDNNDGSRDMVEKRNVSFWNFMNLRIAVVNAVIMAVIGVASVYTTNLLTQQAFANRLDLVEAVANERLKTRDDKFTAIETKLNNLVDKQVLDLSLQPIRDDLSEQRKTLNEIRLFMIRNPNFTPLP